MHNNNNICLLSVHRIHLERGMDLMVFILTLCTWNNMYLLHVRIRLRIVLARCLSIHIIIICSVYTHVYYKSIRNIRTRL